MTKNAKGEATDEGKPAAPPPAPGAGLTGPLERWRALAARFALDDAAAAAGALLVATELDETARSELLGELADKAAPRRRDLIAALAENVDPGRAAAAVALEARGLVVTFKQYAGPWALAEVALDPHVRQQCLQAASSPSLPSPPEPGRGPRAGRGAGRPLGAAGSSPAGAIGGGAAAGRRPARAGAVRQRGGLGRAPLGPDAGRSRPRPAVVAPQPDRVRGPRGSPPGRPGRGGAPHPGPRPGPGLRCRDARHLGDRLARFGRAATAGSAGGGLAR